MQSTQLFEGRHPPGYGHPQQKLTFPYEFQIPSHRQACYFYHPQCNQHFDVSAKHHPCLLP